MAAAATLGVLIGFGSVRGAALRPLNGIAHTVFGTRAYLMHGFDPAVTLAALVIHVASVVAWGVIFALLAGRLRGARLIAAALLYAAAVALVDRLLVPPTLVPGFNQALTHGEIATIYVILAVSLAAGSRLRAGD